MTTQDQLLTTLLQRLDEPVARYSTWQAYLEGRQPISYLAPEARTALGNRLSSLSVNVPALLVNSVAERLRVTGFAGVDVWDDWLASDLDQQSPVLHREALAYGDAYCICWADADGRPNVTVESPRQVTTLHDPGTRQIIAAVKRWNDDAAGVTNAILYGPDQIVRYRASSTGATVSGFKIVETIPNPLGAVPVVRFRNGHRIVADFGWSEMSDVLTLTDALVKLTTDMMVASEFGARPRRWATGLELEERDILDDDGQPTGETEAVNPVSESERMMINEDAEGKFGQLPGSDLIGYENAIRTVMQQISAVSGLPPHMLGQQGDNPTSADSIRASEAALTARAEARQLTFGRSWEQVARLMVAVRDGVDPASVQPRVQWADPATRSVAQEADAVTKLYAAGLLPASYALAKLGYDADEIDAIRAARRADQLDQLGTSLDKLLTGPAAAAPAAPVVS